MTRKHKNPSLSIEYVVHGHGGLLRGNRSLAYILRNPGALTCMYVSTYTCIPIHGCASDCEVAHIAPIVPFYFQRASERYNCLHVFADSKQINDCSDKLSRDRTTQFGIKRQSQKYRSFSVTFFSFQNLFFQIIRESKDVFYEQKQAVFLKYLQYFIVS